MSTYAHEEMLNEVASRLQSLPPNEQKQFLDDLVTIIHQRMATRPKKHSVKELRGLGKELWRGIDVEKYIEEERNSWDG